MLHCHYYRLWGKPCKCSKAVVFSKTTGFVSSRESDQLAERKPPVVLGLLRDLSYLFRPKKKPKKNKNEALEILLSNKNITGSTFLTLGLDFHFCRKHEYTGFQRKAFMVNSPWKSKCLGIPLCKSKQEGSHTDDKQALQNATPTAAQSVTAIDMSFSTNGTARSEPNPLSLDSYTSCPTCPGAKTSRVYSNSYSNSRWN